jgi:hypothetical protein
VSPQKIPKKRATSSQRRTLQTGLCSQKPGFFVDFSFLSAKYRRNPVSSPVSVSPETIQTLGTGASLLEKSICKLGIFCRDAPYDYFKESIEGDRSMKSHENFVRESCREITSNQTTARELIPRSPQSYEGMERPKNEKQPCA